MISCIPDSYLEQSLIKQNIFALSMCLKKALPSHFPSAAPLIRPGISITLNVRSSACTQPRFGIRVVKGYSATFAFA